MSRRDPFSIRSQQGSGPAAQEQGIPPAISPYQAPVDGIPRAVEKPARRRNYEKAHREGQLSVRGVPHQIRDAVRDLAADLDVPTDEVAGVFLEYALMCYRRGEIKLSARVYGRHMTLFTRDGWGREIPGWQEVTGWTSVPQKLPVSKAKKKSAGKERSPRLWQTVVTYRRIPRQIKDQIIAICEEMCIPRGQLVSSFLAHALQRYEAGLLILNLSPRTKESLTSVEEPCAM